MRHHSFFKTQSFKQRMIILIGGVLLGTSTFLATNPEFGRSLMSDIAPSGIVKNYQGDIGYIITSSKLTVISNADIGGVQHISLTIAHNPEKEILIKKPSQGIKITKQGPSMTTYDFDLSHIKSGDSIAVFQHNGDKEDFSLGGVEILTDDAKSIIPSISIIKN